MESYWQPYHQRLADEMSRAKSEHGFVLPWDAHSIQSQEQRFFEGRLSDLNLGTAGGLSRAAMATLPQEVLSIMLTNNRG